jgi:hypothetical protein
MPNKWSIGLAAVALSAVFISSSEAQKPRGFIRLGGDFGGDPVIQFVYSDGTTPDLEAGRGPWSLPASRCSCPDRAAGDGGVKYTSIPPAGNQDASWLRYPLEGVLLYHLPFPGLAIRGRWRCTSPT